MPLKPNYMQKKARSAYKDYTAPYKRDEEEDKPIEDFRAAPDNVEDEGSDKPADVSGLAKKEKEKEKSDSNWGKKVVAAIAGIGGAVAGANLQHKQNQRREKLYQAKRKTGNYL